MAFKKNQPGCNASGGCGCAQQCPIDSDDFSATNDPPSGWTEEVGSDWETTGGTLRTSTSNASLTFNTSHPDALASAIATAYLYGADGDELRIQVNKTDDNNYHFAQLRIGDPNGCLELWERVAGVETMLSVCRVPAPAATFNKVVVYFGLDLFAAALVTGTDDANNRLSFKVTGGTGDQVGVGTGTISGEVQFNDFTFDRHREASGDWTVCNKYPASCYVIGDLFTRSDNTDLGCGWEEVSGDWEVDTNTLAIAATSAILRCTTEHTTAGNAASISVMARGASNDLIRLIVAYDPAAPTTYYFCEWKVNTTTGYLKVYRKTAGVDTQLATVNVNCDPNVAMSLSLCISGTRVTAAISGTFTGGFITGVAIAGAVNTPIVGARYVCLGTGSQANDVHFNNFVYTRAYDPDNTGCLVCVENCSCCDDSVSPSTGTGRIQGVVGIDDLCCGNPHVAPDYFSDVSFPMYRWSDGCSYISNDPFENPCSGVTDTDPCGTPWYVLVTINCTTGKVRATIYFNGALCVAGSVLPTDSVVFEADIPDGGDCNAEVEMTYLSGAYANIGFCGAPAYDFTGATFTWTPD